MKNPLYPFMKAVSGNWRNAIYLSCKSCSYGKESLCSGFLLTTDEEGKPLILSVEQFHTMTGEVIDKEECAAILQRPAFEAAYALWLRWQIDDPTSCPLLQLTL